MHFMVEDVQVLEAWRLGCNLADTTAEAGALGPRALLITSNYDKDVEHSPYKLHCSIHRQKSGRPSCSSSCQAREDNRGMDFQCAHNLHAQEGALFWSLPWGMPSIPSFTQAFEW